jgi:hypothetical protein
MLLMLSPRVRCKLGLHRRDGATIRRDNQTWRAECIECGVSLIRTAPRQWREYNDDEDPIRVAPPPQPIKSDQQIAYEMALMLRDEDVATDGQTNRDAFFKLYSECVAVVQGREPPLLLTHVVVEPELQPLLLTADMSLPAARQPRERDSLGRFVKQ